MNEYKTVNQNFYLEVMHRLCDEFRRIREEVGKTLL